MHELDTRRTSRCRLRAEPVPTNQPNLESRSLDDRRNFARTKEFRCVSQNRLQSSRRLKLHEQTRNCTNEPKFAVCFAKSPIVHLNRAFSANSRTTPRVPPAPNCTNKLRLPCPHRVSPRAPRSKDLGLCLQPKLHEQTPPNGFPKLGLFRTFAQPTHSGRLPHRLSPLAFPHHPRLTVE
jgi:hypothetical protein